MSHLSSYFHPTAYIKTLTTSSPTTPKWQVFRWVSSPPLTANGHEWSQAVWTICFIPSLLSPNVHMRPNIMHNVCVPPSLVATKCSHNSQILFTENSPHPIKFPKIRDKAPWINHSGDNLWTIFKKNTQLSTMETSFVCSKHTVPGKKSTSKLRARTLSSTFSAWVVYVIYYQLVQRVSGRVLWTNSIRPAVHPSFSFSVTVVVEMLRTSYKTPYYAPPKSVPSVATTFKDT